MDNIKKIIQDNLGQFIGEPNTPETQAKIQSILIPMIRNVLPTTIAQDIVGVQPMTLPLRMAPPYQIAEQYTEVVPQGYVVINANREVSQWIEQQPLHHWKHGELTNIPGFWERFIISEELFTWLKLRWQA